MDLTLLTYTLTADFPKHELYGLTSQMRRAAVSVPSNIAEGAARESRKDFRQFILIARGSTSELQTQLLIAARLGYCAEPKLLETERLAAEVGKMLNGLARYLKAKAQPKPHQPAPEPNHQPPTTNHQPLTTNH